MVNINYITEKAKGSLSSITKRLLGKINDEEYPLEKLFLSAIKYSAITLGASFILTGGIGYLQRQITGDYSSEKKRIVGDSQVYEDTIRGIESRIRDSRISNRVDLSQKEIMFTTELDESDAHYLALPNQEARLEDLLIAVDFLRAHAVNLGFNNEGVSSFPQIVNDSSSRANLGYALEKLSLNGIDAYVYTNHEADDYERSIFPESKLFYEVLAIDRFFTRINQEPVFAKVKQLTLKSDKKVNEYLAFLPKVRGKTLEEQMKLSPEIEVIEAIDKFNSDAPEEKRISGIVSDSRMYVDRTNTFSLEMNSLFLDVHRLLKDKCNKQGIEYRPVFDASWDKPVKYEGNIKKFWMHLLDITSHGILSDLGYSSINSNDPYNRQYELALPVVSYVRGLNHLGEKKRITIMANINDETDKLEREKDYTASWNSRIYPSVDEPDLKGDILPASYTYSPDDFPMRDYDDFVVDIQKLLRTISERQEPRTLYQIGSISIGLSGSKIGLDEPFFARSDRVQDYLENLYPVTE